MKFTDYRLHPLVQAGVDACNYEECTPIQSATIPHILAGQDIAGLAQTGTGKTAAFLLPLMDRIVRSKNPDANAISEDSAAALDSTEDLSVELSDDGEATISDEVQVISEDSAIVRPIFPNWKPTNFVLALVPTRELAEQVHENVKKLGAPAGMRSVAIYGGIGYDAQTKAVQEGVEFIVATPGRLIDLYKENQVDLAQVRAVIFDEADRMFDMGFKDDMKYILKRIPSDRQFLVFSATLNFDVLNTAYEFGANPIEVNVSKDQTKADNVTDEIFHVGQEDKPKYLVSLLKKHKPKQAIVFSNFKNEVAWLATFLTKNGLPAMGISSLISQNQRTRIMEQFRKENNSNILVATDVAARGLDVKGVDMVINFQLPDDAENYVHRIGRTGRAGEKGQAFSLVSDRDVEALQRIETYLSNKVTIGWLEDSDIVTDVIGLNAENRERRPPPHRTQGGDRNQGRSFNKNRPDNRGPQGGKRPFDKPRDGAAGPFEKRDGAAGPFEKREGKSFEARPPRAEGERMNNSKPDNTRRPDASKGQDKSVNARPSAPRTGEQRSFKKSSFNDKDKNGQGKSFKGKPFRNGDDKNFKNKNPDKHSNGEVWRPPKGYKYQPPAAKSKGVMASVKGFIKKIFGA